MQAMTVYDQPLRHVNSRTTCYIENILTEVNRASVGTV